MLRVYHWEKITFDFIKIFTSVLLILINVKNDSFNLITGEIN